MSNWLNVGIKGTAIWPNAETEIEFGGHKLVLKPATRETEQSIHIDLDKISEPDALTLINRFLSVLAWCDDQPMENRYGWSGNPVPVAIPKEVRIVGSSVAFPFGRDIDASSAGRLALALYREARTVNSTPYEFLGYFKILNIFWVDKYQKKGNVRTNELVEGIRAFIPKLQYQEARSRVANLSLQQADVAAYLYASGRCAIAHANAWPLVDPDEISDLRRLSMDMPIIKGIAELLIEDQLKISRSIIQ